MSNGRQESKEASVAHLPHPQTVYCLAIDLVKSTSTGLSLRSWQNDRFNAALVQQLNPHLAALQLDHAVVKFTGDGWLIMSPTAVSQLCYLAVVFRDSFRREMSALTQLPMDKIPVVRGAVCSGRDLEVKTPGGHRDYVGDSVRRAVRASALSQDGEVLVSDTVREWVQRDFEVSAEDVTTERPLPKKWEEPIILHTLTGLKPSVAADSMMPADFVYTLGKVGKREDSVAAVVAVAERFQVTADAAPLLEGHLRAPSQASVGTPEPTTAGSSRPLLPANEWNRVLNALPDFSAAQLLVRALREKQIPREAKTYNILANKAPNLTEAMKILTLMADDSIPPNDVTYTTLIGKAESYPQAIRLLEEMKAAGLAPSVVTYNTLISRAESYSEATRLLEEMKAAGLPPDTFTQTILINKAESYVEATRLLEQMKAAGLPPSVVTYTTLISKAKSYPQAIRLLEEMKAAGLPPNAVTYNTLISKAKSYSEATRLLEEMKVAGIPPNTFTQTTLISKAESYVEATRLLEEMKAAGLPPSVVTYNTLISKAGSYAEASRLLEEMKAAGLPPNVVTYSSLFAKPMKGIGAREVLDWYYREKYHPCGPLDALITSFRKDRRTADALEVALEHPHLGSARRLMKEKTKHAQQKFEDAKNSEPRHPTADFALGALHMTKGDRATARRHLLNALEIAPHPQQRATIQKWLTDIDARSAPGDQRS